MVSTPNKFTENNPIPPCPYMTVKNTSARKWLCLFTEVLDVKKKTAVRRVGADKSKRKEIISCSMLWSSITKRIGHTKINERVNKYIYNWNLQHPQVVQSPMANYWLKVSIDGHSEPQLVPNFLLKVSVRELHNSMVIPLEEGVLKEARYTDNNIIISDSTLRSIIPPHIKNMYARYKVICSCEFCISAKIIHSELLSCSDSYLKNLNNPSKNPQKRRSIEKDNHLFDTYKNSAMPNGHHVYQKAYAMDMDTMCAYPPYQHEFPHWKCVLRCYSNLPWIYLPGQ